MNVAMRTHPSLHSLVLVTLCGISATSAEPRVAPEVPLAEEIPRIESLAFPNLDFEDGTREWRVSGESVKAAPGVGRHGSTALRVPNSGSVSRTLAVSRGSENMKGRRYLVTAWVRPEAEGAYGAISLHGSTWRSSGKQNWELVEAIADTRVRAPGGDTETFALSFSSGPTGSVLFDDVSVHHVPSYGVHVRYKVLEPKQGVFNGQAYIIRRHRDTSHTDPARHRYHAGVDGLGGADGVAAGQFSPWSDLRRYLFGTQTSTVSLKVNPQEEGTETRPVTVIIELSFLPAGSGAQKSGGRGGDLLELTDEEAEPEAEFEEVKADPEATVSEGVFFRCTHRSENGRFAFLMPESDLPPSRFLRSLSFIDHEIEERYRWASETLAPLPKLPCRIPVGANLSALNMLIGRDSIRKELEVLTRIGISAISRGASVETSLFDEIRLKQFRMPQLRDRMYCRIGNDEFFSPYDGDRLAKTMHRKFARLAEDLQRQGEDAVSAVSVIELMDEPPNYGIAKTDLDAFRAFLKGQGLSPRELGAANWEEIRPSGFSETPTEDQETPDNPGAAVAEDDEFLTEAENKGEPQESEGGPATAATDRPTQDQRRLLYYTRLFSAKKTSDLFRTATAAVEKHLPGVRTSVNFRSGVRQVLTSETADWFRMGRDRAVTMLWNEDWLNTYGWRRNGIQLVSYYTELMRTAARKHKLPVGGFLIMMGHAELKSYSALAHGSRYLHYWRYGPSYANYLPYSWSHSPGAVKEVATICRDVARIEETLCEARREPAEVALLYAKSDPIWGRSQAENRLVYFALLHDQVPVDLVTEAEIEEDDILDAYKFLYLTDVSVRQASLRKVAKWVQSGGAVWLSGGAGTRDEFDEPTQILASALGVRSKLLPGQSKELALPDDEPVASATSVYDLATDAGASVLVRFRDGSPAQVVGRAGDGRYCVSAFRPGILYEGTVRPYFNRSAGKGRIQKGWRKSRRDWVTQFALSAGLVRPIQIDRPCVEVALYRHEREDIAMFMNYTGEALGKPLAVRVRCGRAIATVESLRQGKLEFEQGADWVSFKLPLVLTDSVILK